MLISSTIYLNFCFELKFEIDVHLSWYGCNQMLPAHGHAHTHNRRLLTPRLLVTLFSATSANSFCLFVVNHCQFASVYLFDSKCKLNHYTNCVACKMNRFGFLDGRITRDRCAAHYLTSLKIRFKFNFGFLFPIQRWFRSHVSDRHDSNPWRPSFIENGQIVRIHCLAYHPINLFGSCVATRWVRIASF